MRVTFKLTRTPGTTNPFGYSFCRAQQNPLSDSPVRSGAMESRWFANQDELTSHLNETYWMFFGTEEMQANLKTFLKGAGKARKKGEGFEMNFPFTTRPGTLQEFPELSEI